VSFSVPHFLQVELLLSPFTCRCLHKVLCPVSRPITALDCVLLKDNNRAPVSRLGPEINSQFCLCIPQGLRHNARCCLCIQHFIFLPMFCLATSGVLGKVLQRLYQGLLYFQNVSVRCHDTSVNVI